jgi:hypothetical protein
MQEALFRRIDVWRPLSPERAIRYNCIEDVRTGLFRVCTADFVDPGAAMAQDQARYFVEAILAWDWEDPQQPQWFHSVEVAIADHDACFAD